jgi:spore coat protein A, manganese oxidase
MMDPARMNPYLGPAAVSPHLHGGETPSAFDGGPDQWWTPGAEGSFKSPPPSGSYRGAGFVNNAYQYPNAQEPATLWFHDHQLGGTRLNVYGGLAAFYLLRGNGDDGKVQKGRLPAGLQEVEIALQDRSFDTNGQLFFPDVGDNPGVHPYWLPEFFGDVIVVNGKSWPKLQVEPKRYRFRLLEGSNARFYNLTFRVGAVDGPVLPFYVIGTDGGLLDSPVKVDNLLYAPGERYDVIVEFAGKASQQIFLTNDANAPYPDGDPVDPNTTAQIMRFDVGAASGADTSYDPASGNPLRGPGSKVTNLEAIVRLPGTQGGLPLSKPVGDGKKVQIYRQLTLNEVQGPNGPEEILVNNSKWVGKRGMSGPPIPGSVNVGGFGNWMTELPQVGSTEVWDIINLTMDAHPIHLHLVQFQIISRTPFDTTGYGNAYQAAFPGSAYIPAYGPPQDYNTPNAAGAIGGNPDVTNFLKPVVAVPDGLAGAPRPAENGWKDTFIMPPGYVTRVVVRWIPQNFPAAAATTPIDYSGKVLYPFDPTDSDPNHIGQGFYPGGPGYVWHCHIVDHEDNEMMRPYIPSKKAKNKY